MTRAEHDARNAAQITVLLAGVGSGYQPSVWCTNPGCHTPYPAGLPECPECGEATPRLLPHPHRRATDEPAPWTPADETEHQTVELRFSASTDPEEQAALEISREGRRRRLASAGLGVLRVICAGRVVEQRVYRDPEAF